ncbi:hemicentin-1-like [Hydractinia symbiolongicarpus]|uniref:hemicentin-1-like n=1 Tax=Hydractinia symbiolongicarpus TaxID=13093 RepID=UPI00254CDB8F|nr:hemicentin-1-like [Hydractinia symbiolongicarpus]
MTLLTAENSILLLSTRMWKFLLCVLTPALKSSCLNLSRPRGIFHSSASQKFKYGGVAARVNEGYKCKLIIYTLKKMTWNMLLVQCLLLFCTVAALQFMEHGYKDNNKVYTVIGGTFKLDCRVDGSPLPNMIWLKDNQLLQESSFRVFPRHMEKIFVLTLKDLLAADAGNYTCIANNSTAKIIKSVVLDVIEKPLEQKPEIADFSPNHTVVVQVGENVKLSCSAAKIKGVGVPFIKWTRHIQYNLPFTNSANTAATEGKLNWHLQGNKTVLQIPKMSNMSYVKDGFVYKIEDLKLKRTDRSTFELLSASIEDSGEYSCFVFNSKGYSKQSMILTVLSAQIDASTTPSATTRANLNSSQENTYATKKPQESWTTSEETTLACMQPLRQHGQPLRFFQSSSQESYGIVGTKFFLDCCVDGYPQPNISWFKDDKPIQKSSFRVFPQNMENIFVLELEDVLIADTGNYTCIADNNIVKAIAKSVVLNIKEYPLKQKPKIADFSPNHTVVVRVGENVKLSCSAAKTKDEVEPFIKWTRYLKYSLTTTKPTNTTETNKLFNSHQQQNKNEVQVQQISNMSYVEDGVVYNIEDLKLKRTDRSTFELMSASIEDSGEYSCFVFNSKGYSKQSMKLTVVPAQTEASTTPPATTTTTTTKRPHSKSLRFMQRSSQDNQETYAIVGTNFFLNCSVIGYPEPNITWFKDDMPLQESSYRLFPKNMNKMFGLVLKNLLAADAGKYKCVADNNIVKPIATTIVLHIKENTYNQKPEIADFSPNHTVVVQVGESVKLSCSAEKIKDAVVPFIKWTRHLQSNLTISNSTNTTETNKALSSHQEKDGDIMHVQRLSNMSYVKDGVVHKIEDLKLKRTDRSTFELMSASIEDSGEYSCFVFSDKGYSEQSMMLIVLPVPPLTKDQLEAEYLEKYGKSINLPFSLAVLVALPVFLLVLLIIGCVWWHENEKKLEEEKLKLSPAQKTPVVEAQENQPNNIPIVIVHSGTSPDEAEAQNSLAGSQADVTARSPSVTSLAGSKVINEVDEKTANEDAYDDESSLLVLSEAVNETLPSDRGSTSKIDQEWEHI